MQLLFVLFVGGDWSSMKPGEQGKRSDLADAANKVLSRTSMAEIALEHPTTFARYSRGLRDLASTIHGSDRPNSWQQPPGYMWLWGPTGGGKTTRIFSKYESAHIYTKDRTKWFNGFDPIQHRVILIDDFRLTNDSLQLDDFLRIAQPFNCQVETKGGYISLGNQRIYVTSNLPPESIWNEDSIGPLRRRFHIQFVKPVKAENDDGDIFNDSPPGTQIINLD